MTGDGVAGEVRRRSVSANIAAACLLLVVTFLGYALGQSMPSSADWPEARLATGIMGATVGSIFGSLMAFVLTHVVTFAQRARLRREEMEIAQRFEGYLQTHQDFELGLEPALTAAARWALKAGGKPVAMLTDFEADVFRSVIAQTAHPLTLIERSAREVVVSRLVRGVRHHPQDWAMRIYTLGSRYDKADYRDYFFLCGRPVSRETLLEVAEAISAVPEVSAPAGVPRPPRRRQAARPTDALPRLPKLPGVTRDTHGLRA